MVRSRSARRKIRRCVAKLGVENGERVAILSLNSDRYYEFFATPWAGGVFVPINIRLAPPEVAFWLNDSGSEILLIDDRFVPILDELEGQLETVRDVIYVGEGDAPDGMRHIEDCIEAADPLEDAMRGNDNLAGLFYTGGTTGRSKGVMLSHANLVFNNMNCIHTFNYSQGMRWLHACPIFHIAGGIAIFGVTQVAGTHVSIPAYAPDVTAETIQEREVTDTLLVPTMVNMLVNMPGVENFDLSSMKAMAYGARRCRGRHPTGYGDHSRLRLLSCLRPDGGRAFGDRLPTVLSCLRRRVRQYVPRRRIAVVGVR